MIVLCKDLQDKRLFSPVEYHQKGKIERGDQSRKISLNFEDKSLLTCR